jgi:hypothetical protein
MKSTTHVSAALLAGITLYGSSVAAQASPSAWIFDTALPAAKLTDSIGINVHLSYDAYTAHPAQLRSRLLEAGIRHIRTGAFLPAPNDDIERIAALGRDGIRTDLIVDIHTPEDVLQRYLNLAPAVEVVEGPNEYNNSGDSQWVTHVRAFQERLYSEAHAHHLPVVGPSVTSVEAFQQLGDLHYAMDYGNTHNYFAGYNPGTIGWGGGFQGSLYGSLGYNLAAARITAAQRPIYSTETGYCTLPATKNAVSPDIAARYIPRLYLEQWLQHVPRTYVYELIDEGNPGCDSRLGLLTHDFEAKPAFSALRSLTRDLGTTRSAQAPGRLAYRISGVSPSVHHLLVEKRRNELQLLVWNETPSWDINNGTGQPIAVHAQALHLDLESGWKITGVRNFTDRGELEGQQAFIAGRVGTFNVTDRVTVVDIHKN